VAILGFDKNTFLMLSDKILTSPAATLILHALISFNKKHLIDKVKYFLIRRIKLPKAN